MDMPFEEPPTLLIVEDEKNTREGLRRALENRFDVYLAADASSALHLLETEPVDLLLSDLRLGGEMDGMKLITKAKAISKPPICILMTAYGSVDIAVEAMREGAYDYVTKPLHLEKLELLLLRAWKEKKVQKENRQLRTQLHHRYGLDQLIGSSPPMVRVLDLIQQVADSTATILIEGESGTGKELVAQAIHQLSGRKEQPFLIVHCAALSPQLLESELFGHERGSFTGASSRRIGRFEEAHHGTLFLDEIGEIDKTTQVKLLRALGSRSIQRVGSNQEISINVRVIAATNKTLETLVQQDTFREDLFFRLNEVPLRLPPLRERKEDIPTLAQAFLEETAKENHKRVLKLTSEAQEILLRYDWPGNVRELRTAMVYAITLARGDSIGIKDLPPRLYSQQNLITPTSPQAFQDLNLERMEKQYITFALKKNQGNRTKAAQDLGISRRTLHRKLHDYRLEEA